MTINSKRIFIRCSALVLAVAYAAVLFTLYETPDRPGVKTVKAAENVGAPIVYLVVAAIGQFGLFLTTTRFGQNHKVITTLLMAPFFFIAIPFFLVAVIAIATMGANLGWMTPIHVFAPVIYVFAAYWLFTNRLSLD